MRSKDTNEESLTHSKSDNREITSDDKPGEVIAELSQLLLYRYSINLETTVKGSSFLFDHVHLLYYKCHERNSNCGGSYTDSCDWIRKPTINPIKKIINAFNMLQHVH